MNKIIVLISTFFLCTSFTGDKEVMTFEEIKSLKKEFKPTCSFRYDNMEQVIWFGSKKKYEMNQSKSEVYFGLTEQKELYSKRLKVVYEGSSWLFVEKLIFSIGSKRKDNQRIYEVPLSDKDVDRKVLSGKWRYNQ